MKYGPFFAAALMATMGSGLAYAQGGPGPHERGAMMQERFADLDTNGDGRITRAEAEARAAADFAAADTDGDGALSEEEATAFHQERHQDRHAERMALHEERRAERHEERGGRHFERAAGDDGMIDADEFAAHGLHRFEMADLDENGEVTQTEMELVASVMGGRHGRHHGRHEGRHRDHMGDDD